MALQLVLGLLCLGAPPRSLLRGLICAKAAMGPCVYTRLDMRLAWQLRESVEVSIDGQNLLRPSHAEFHNAYEVRKALVQRSIFTTIAWRF